MSDLAPVKPELEKEIDQALHFTAKKLDESGHDSKPVLFHSFKIARLLYSSGYDREIVLAAVLHDLIEDTDTTKEEIEEEYGKEIADIVEAVSFDPDLEDYMERTREMFERCLKCGRAALLVKCADLLDNISFIYIEEPTMQTLLLEKYRLFIQMSKEVIGDEEIYERLVGRFDMAFYLNSPEVHL